MTLDLQLVLQALAFSVRSYSEASISDAPTSTEVLVGGLLDEPDTLLIAFRGSREPLDFIMDAKFVVKHWWSAATNDSAEARARVHRGFANGFFAVSDAVLGRVQGARRIIITGHSLGGARAIYCAAWLKSKGYPVTDVITFGCPRVGNEAFAEFYNAMLHDQTLRFEAQGDPIPWTPPWLVNGYRHVGRAAYLKNDGALQLEPALWDHVPAYLATLGRVASHNRSELFGVFNPHFITNYERLLKNVKSFA